MLLSLNLPVSPLFELVEGLFVKKAAPTMTQTTPISRSIPVSQLQPLAPNLPNTHPNPYLHDRK